jgi:hypothetical protein
MATPTEAILRINLSKGLTESELAEVAGIPGDFDDAVCSLLRDGLARRRATQAQRENAGLSAKGGKKGRR